MTFPRRPAPKKIVNDPKTIAASVLDELQTVGSGYAASPEFRKTYVRSRLSHLDDATRKSVFAQVVQVFPEIESTE